MSNEELIKEYSNLIKAVANRTLYPNEKHYFDDLYQEGIIIMLEVFPKFKKEGPAKFGTYLYATLKRKLYERVTEYKTGMNWNQYREIKRKERMLIDADFAKNERARKMRWHNKNKSNPEYKKRKLETQRRYMEKKRLTNTMLVEG